MDEEDLSLISGDPAGRAAGVRDFLQWGEGGYRRAANPHPAGTEASSQWSHAYEGGFDEAAIRSIWRSYSALQI